MDPSGIFATSYGRDSALVRTRAQWLALALLAADALRAGGLGRRAPVGDLVPVESG